MTIHIHSVDEQESPDKRNAKQKVGAHLKKTRLEKGWKLPEIADELCIRKDYLVAIENGDADKELNACYALGFVRSYANYLGLDGQDMVDRYKNEYLNGKNGHDDVIPDVPNLPVMESSGTPNSLIMTMCALVLIMVYTVWHFTQPKSNGLDVPAQVTEATSTDGGEAQTPSAVTPEEEAAKPEKKSISKILTADADVAPVIKEPAIAIRATEETWVQVGDGEKLPIISKLMSAGEVFRVPAESTGLKLITGNAGAVEVLVHGQAVAPLGSYGMVLRNVMLDPELLRTGRAVIN